MCVNNIPQLLFPVKTSDLKLYSLRKFLGLKIQSSGITNDVSKLRRTLLYNYIVLKYLNWATFCLFQLSLLQIKY